MSEPLAAGESLQILRNGAAITAAVIVDGDSWRFTDSRLADGSYAYTARVADAEGAGPLSGAYRITVDTDNDKTASITSVTDNVAPGLGNVPDGGSTNDSTPTLNGRLSAGLAAGEELQVLRDDTVITSSPTVSGLNWSYTDTVTRSGNYDYTVRVVDAAGNVGRESGNFDLRVSLPRGSEADALATEDLLDAGASSSGAGLLAVAEPVPQSAEPFGASSAIATPPGNSLDELLTA